MKRICLCFLIGLLLISLPVLGTCASWADVAAGLSGAGSYSGDGVSATRSDNTVTITGGTISGFLTNIKDITNYNIKDATLTGDTIITNSWNASQVNLDNVNINGNTFTVTANETGASPVLQVDYSGNAKLTKEIELASWKGTVVRFNNRGNLSTDSVGSPFRIEQTSDSTFAFNNLGSVSVTSGDSPSVPRINVSLDAPLSDQGAYETVINNLHITGVDTADVTFWVPNGGDGLIEAAEFKNYPLNSAPRQQQQQQQNEEPDWEPSRAEIKAHEMEEKRQAASAGNVMGSPWPCYQLNLNYASRNLWVRGQDGEKVFHTSYVNWLGTGRDAEKNLTLKVQLDEMDGVNIRYDRTVLDIFDRCGITQITVINDYDEVYMVYSVAGMRAAHEAAGLKRREILVIGGPDDEIMTCGKNHESTPVPVVFPELEETPAENP